MSPFLRRKVENIELIVLPSECKSFTLKKIFKSILSILDKNYNIQCDFNIILIILPAYLITPFKIALLRYNLYTIKFTHLKCMGQC